MNLLAELRRRSVFRVAAAYLISGWVVMQVVSLIATTARMPEWAAPLVLMILIAGLPIALIVAWAFELSPDGPKRTEAAGDAAVKPFGVVDGILIGGLVLVIGAVVWQQFSTPETLVVEVSVETLQAEAIIEGPEAASIAVLAFDDLSPEGDQEYFSDGISEELLNVLVRVEGLRVASRTSAFRFKGSNASIPEIGLDLNVRHVLEGSVRRSGNTIRITAQLIDSATDEHLWSDTYDRELTASNLFEVQDDIATAIVAALSERLQGILPVADIEVETTTENLTAYELFLQARPLFLARQNLALADQYLAQAIELDPAFNEAWELRAAIRYLGIDYGGFDGEPESQYALAIEFAETAIGIDPNSSVAVSVISKVAGELNYSPDVASIRAEIDGYSRALEIDPHNTTALNWRGMAYGFVGEFDLALSDFESCLEIEPYYIPCRGNLVAIYPAVGNDQAAYDAFIELRNQGGYLDVYPLGAMARLGKRDTFLIVAATLYGSNAPWGDHDVLFEMVQNPEGDFDHLLEAITEYELARDTFVFPYMGVDVLLGNYERLAEGFGSMWTPEFAAYRRSEIYQRHLADGPLPEYWRTYGFPPQCRERDDGWIECD